MIRKLVNGNKGIIVADALIAVLILTIFLSIISTLSYSIYLAASFTKRNSNATNYGIDIVEYIDRIPYDDLTYESLINYINSKSDSQISAKSIENANQLLTPYKMILNIQKYNEMEGNTDKLDLIKIVTVRIEYNLGNTTKHVEIERVKKREPSELVNVL